MDFHRIIFEKGIELWRGDDHGAWRVRSAPDPQAAMTPEQIGRAYDVRPIVLASCVDPQIETTVLLPIASPLGRGPVLDQAPYQVLRIPDLGRLPVTSHIFNASYMLGGVVYHCMRLAEVYALITRRFASFRRPEPERDTWTFGNQPEPYYELEALISAAMRAYDTTLTHMIWWIGSGKKGQMPGSFEKTLPRCTRLPATLKTRLEASWTRYGAPLNDYRDCIHHHVQLGPPLPNAILRRLPGGVWSTFSPIPDNPRDRSQRKFRYEGNLDALTYGWELTNEAVDITRAVVDHAQAIGAAPPAEPPAA